MAVEKVELSHQQTARFLDFCHFPHFPQLQMVTALANEISGVLRLYFQTYAWILCDHAVSGHWSKTGVSNGTQLTIHFYKRMFDIKQSRAYPYIDPYMVSFHFCQCPSDVTLFALYLSSCRNSLDFFVCFSRNVSRQINKLICGPLRETLEYFSGGMFHKTYLSSNLSKCQLFK